MKKSSLFISAILTSFVLVIMVGAFNAFRASAEGTTLLSETAQISQDVQQVEATTVMFEPSPDPAFLSPQEAAQLIASYLGRTDLYSVQGAIFYGLDAYEVVFSNGDIAYVSPQGDVMKVVQANVQSVQVNNGSQSVSASHDSDGGDEGDDDD